MNDAIIGGAIAAVMGAVGYAIVGLFLERRREKAQKLTIVDALIIETAENLTICTSPKIREMWWLAPFKLEAYQTYKGQIFFLSEKVRLQLVAAVLVMEGCNVIIQTRLSREGFGQPVDEKPTPIPEYLIKQLEFVNEELRKWRGKHTR